MFGSVSGRQTHRNAQGAAAMRRLVFIWTEGWLASQYSVTRCTNCLPYAPWAAFVRDSRAFQPQRVRRCEVAVDVLSSVSHGVSRRQTHRSTQGAAVMRRLVFF